MNSMNAIQLVGIALIFSVAAFADGNCPDLAGNYGPCEYTSGGISTTLKGATVSQSVSGSIITYRVGSDEVNVNLDGSVLTTTINEPTGPYVGTSNVSCQNGNLLIDQKVTYTFPGGPTVSDKTTISRNMDGTLTEKIKETWGEQSSELKTLTCARAP